MSDLDRVWDKVRAGVIRPDAACIECAAPVDIEWFDGEIRCWYCGHRLLAVHECYEDGECYDYVATAGDE